MRRLLVVKSVGGWGQRGSGRSEEHGWGMQERGGEWAFRGIRRGMRGRRARPGRFGSLAFATKNRYFGGRALLDISRESTKMGQILGVCVCPKSW